MRRPSHRSERGYALILAMLVVVMATLLVVGAITFTGAERATASVRTHDARLSACLAAARNAAMSRMRLGTLSDDLSQASGSSPLTALDGFDLPVEENPAHPAERMRVTTGHLDAGLPAVTVTGVTLIPGDFVGGSGGETDLANRLGTSVGVLGGGSKATYQFSVLCREYPGGPERELDFVMRF